MSTEKLPNTVNTKETEPLRSVTGKPIEKIERGKEKQNFDKIFEYIIQKHLGWKRLTESISRYRLSLFISRKDPVDAEEDVRAFHPIVQKCWPKDMYPPKWHEYYGAGFWGLIWEFQRYRVNKLKCPDHETCKECGSYPCLRPDKPPCELLTEQEKEWKKGERPSASKWARSVYGEVLNLGEHFGVCILESCEEDTFLSDSKSFFNFAKAKKAMETEVIRSMNVEDKLKQLGLSVNSWKQIT